MIASIIGKRIDKFCADKNAAEERRTHLGASLIGQECPRQTWYGFRWAKDEKFDGRMCRLFQRGHLEEFRFVDYLRGIGFTVYEVDSEGNQFRISDVMGHMGGSTDGVCYFPAKFPYLQFDPLTTPVQLEFKTASDKSFKRLVLNGMKKDKPQHWAQICTYGYKMGISWFLYMCVNKNNDDLHIEFGPIDLEHGKAMIAHGESIIKSPVPPIRKFPKSHYKCKFCNFENICHFNEPMEQNCRSCINALPIENKQWFCILHNGVIDKAFIPKGCDSWKPADV